MSGQAIERFILKKTAHWSSEFGTKDDYVGWGETYGLVAPQATAAIIQDLFQGFLIGRNPLDVSSIYEDLYDLMRVRGYGGGFYHDALAAVDIALWDICGKMTQQPIAQLLGGVRKPNPTRVCIGPA